LVIQFNPFGFIVPKIICLSYFSILQVCAKIKFDIYVLSTITGLLAPGGMIRSVVNASALTWFITYI
jgi:hypothetical protein